MSEGHRGYMYSAKFVGFAKDDGNERLWPAFEVCLKERHRLLTALEWIAAKAKRTGQNQIAFVAQQAIDGEEPNLLREIAS